MLSIRLLAATSCSGSASWQHYSDSFLEFDYPPGLKTQHVRGASSSFSDLIVDLSAQDLPEPCVRSETSEECDSTRGVELKPGELFASWWNWGFPGTTFGTGNGTQIQVGGRVAYKATSGETICDRVSDGKTVVVVPLPDVPDNWIELDACYRAEDSATVEPIIERMLQSVQWHQ